MRTTGWRFGGTFAVVSTMVIACGGDHSAADGTGGGSSNTGGQNTGGNGSGGSPAAGGNGSGKPIVDPVPSQTYSALKAKADDAQALDEKGALAAFPTAFKPLQYDPLKAQYLDRIQGSALALTDGDKAALGKNGFVISTAREFPTFVRGFAEIYSEHLPVYITIDSILEAVHDGYDTMLLGLELSRVIPDTKTLLTNMRSRLAASSAPENTRKDVDVYLAVALSLLQGGGAAPVAGGDSAQISALLNKARAASGTDVIDLFGTKREEDFSQFQPRGHYTDTPELQQYFRAMIWLGRVDMRLVETDPHGSQHFNRTHYDAMLALHDLLGDDVALWKRIDDVLQTFVGKSDNMVVPEVDALVADLGGADAARSADDKSVVQALVNGGYGEQQIASYLMMNDGTVKTLPLNRSFFLFGQRYIVDSDVFSSVVFDRIEDRMMPNPLDAAFGALGNNQALALVPDLAQFAELPGALARTRVLIDSKDEAFWDSSFYNLWLESLRALSPAPSEAAWKEGLPGLAKTEAWGRRVLNAQLGSWAELRHDTLLYAKQSYTGIPGCDFPDAYVDPYPEAFGAIRKYAEQGSRIAALTTGQQADVITAYFQTLRNAASILEQIATQELSGQALTAEQLAFINDAVRIEEKNVVCSTIEVPNGWLAKLYFDPMQSIEFDPTIADVHTQPADEGGNPVGKVLHVGTGYPRYMVATIDSCGGGPRAYAGVVFAYHEQTTLDFERLTDEAWAQRFTTGDRPPNVPWIEPVLGK